MLPPPLSPKKFRATVVKPKIDNENPLKRTKSTVDDIGFPYACSPTSDEEVKEGLFSGFTDNVHWAKNYLRELCARKGFIPQRDDSKNFAVSRTEEFNGPADLGIFTLVPED